LRRIAEERPKAEVDREWFTEHREDRGREGDGEQASRGDLDDLAQSR
jgi:hypothetical protein